MMSSRNRHCSTVRSPPQAFALSKRQIRQPALDRMKDPVLDAAVERIWTAPETLARIRDYVARTLRK